MTTFLHVPRSFTCDTSSHTSIEGVLNRGNEGLLRVRSPSVNFRHLKGEYVEIVALPEIAWFCDSKSGNVYTPLRLSTLERL